MGTKSASIVVVTAALVCAKTPAARAYCRAALCENGIVGSRCEPPTLYDCAIPLAWPSSCFHWALAAEPSVFLEREATRTAIQRASAAWSAIDCGSEVRLDWREFEPLVCDSLPSANGAPNVTLIRVLDEGWPYPGVYALTTYTFDVATATLLGADITIDASSRALTTSDSHVEIDLQGLVTHELGHVLGLAHSGDTTAAMYAAPLIGSIAWRELAPDDRLGACAASAGAETDACPTRETIEQRCTEPEVLSEPTVPEATQSPPLAAPASCAGGAEAGASGLAVLGVTLKLAYVIQRLCVNRARSGPRKRYPVRLKSDR